MSLKEKYSQLITAAQQSGVNNLNITEKDNVLYIDGDAPSEDVKSKLWNIYGSIDPNYKSGDVIMNVNAAVSSGMKARVDTNESSLNIRKGPDTDDEIVGKAAKDEVVTIVRKENDQWWVIKTDAGEEGYAYAQYLAPL